MKRTLVFDFDGTIADTMDLVVRIMRDISIEMDHDINIDLKKLREQNLKELFEELEISVVKIPIIITRVKSEIRKEINNCQPIPGIKKILEKLSVKNRLGIMSSNSQDNVERFLKNNHIDHFDFVYGSVGIFGKTRAFKKMIKEQKIDIDDLIYIGDEVRDVESAKKAKVKICAVTWGFNGPSILKIAKPDYLIDEPEQLLTAF